MYRSRDSGLTWVRLDELARYRLSHDPAGQPFHQVLSIGRVDNQLFIGSDPGLFYVYDSIPRGNGYESWLARLQGNTWLLSGSALALLLMVVLSTRLISMLLQLEVLGINKIAPVFYLSPFGRWKLYRRYRQRLRTVAQMTSSYEHFIDLPFESDRETIGPESADPAGQALKLSDLFSRMPATTRAVVIAEGGRGKSTLCHYLARRCLETRDIFQGKRSEPVVINGLSYSGDLVGVIANTLNQNRAYVNKSIVSSQMAAGYLLVIFDGFSEIRETYLAPASRDLSELVNKPDTPFIFTSRSSLPSEVYAALGDCTTIKLRDVDETTIRPFLAQYLKRGEQEVDALMKEIEVHFKALPRIPLMLKLVATVYDQKARVPKDTVTLFADYAEQVLRPDATGINEPIGLHYAIRHLVRETYLRSGGDRGLTLDQGVELLEKIKDRLESYEIAMAPIKLLRLLIRAGLYEQIDGSLRFFHDSFESYFAARTLENDFREKRYELIGMSAGNQRLKETWSFLEAMLDKPEDAERLRQVVTEISPKRETRLRELEQLLGNPYPRIPEF